MAQPLPLQLLSTLRIGIGTACFLFPSLTCKSLFYSIPTGSLLAVRMVGGRDAALGSLLLEASSGEARRNILLAGIIVDVLDIVACAWGFGNGDLEGLPALAFSGGAGLFIGLALLGWGSVGDRSQMKKI